MNNENAKARGIIERVGRALAAAEGCAYDPVPYDGRARAAIEEMRRPTAAMLKAGEDVGHEAVIASLEPGEGIDGYDMAPVWDAMVNEALKEARPDDTAL